MTMQILVGADPEVFVKAKGSRYFSSAHNLIPGTKAQPFAVNRGAVQVDGMALEFNINPAENEEEFVANVNTVMAELEAMVPDYKLVIEPYANFPKKTIKDSPEEALLLGCDPDFNAYTGKRNEAPEVNDETMRTAAGHVHIGWGEDLDPQDPEHFEACCMLAKQLDYYLGVGSLLFDHDNTRKTLYGKAGSFRPKPYGMEYRVLSNAWLKDERLMRWVYQCATKAFEDLVEGKCPANEWEMLARGIIDKEDYGPNTEGFIKRMLDELGLPHPAEV